MNTTAVEIDSPVRTSYTDASAGRRVFTTGRVVRVEGQVIVILTRTGELATHTGNAQIVEGPLCPTCRLDVCGYDSEPDQYGEGSYYSQCERCAMLTGHRTHAHTCRYGAAYVAHHPEAAGQTWSTTQVMRPLFEGHAHVGYTCAGHDACGFVERIDVAQ